MRAHGHAGHYRRRMLPCTQDGPFSTSQLARINQVVIIRIGDGRAYCPLARNWYVLLAETVDVRRKNRRMNASHDRVKAGWPHHLADYKDCTCEKTNLEPFPLECVEGGVIATTFDPYELD